MHPHPLCPRSPCHQLQHIHNKCFDRDFDYKDDDDHDDAFYDNDEDNDVLGEK